MASPVHVSELRVFRDDALGSERREVVRGVSFEVAAGERLALVGANGAGKTSLLLALVGALEIEGRIAIGELTVERRTLDRVRRELGFVFADPTDQLFCASVFEEVAFGPRQRGLDQGEIRQRVQQALVAVGLEPLEQRAPAGLSLGEQRRLAIATVLATGPSVMLLDEPTASLDGRARRALLAAVRACEATLVLATHDLDAVLELDARVVLLSDGRVVGTGPAREVLANRELLDAAGLDPLTR